MPLDTARRQKIDRRAGQGIARTSIAMHRKAVAPAKSEAPSAGDAAETHIYFACPECDKRMRVRSALAGKRGACPSCQARIAFPEGISNPGGPKAPPAPAKKPGFSGLRNAVIGSSSAATPPAPIAPKPPRSPRVSGERLAVNSSLTRQPEVQAAAPATSLEPASRFQPQDESARVLVGTVLGLLVGIFAGFIIGKNFAPARENPAAAVQAPSPSVSQETTRSADVAPEEASNLEAEDLTPSITEKAPETKIQAAAAPQKIVHVLAENEPHKTETVVTKGAEPAPIEKTAEEVHQPAEVETIQPVVAKLEAPVLPPEPAPVATAIDADAKPEPAPAQEAKIEAPAKGEQGAAIPSTPEAEQPAPPVAEPAAQPVLEESSASSGTIAPAAASPEPQASSEKPEPAKAEAQSEPAKALPGRPVFTSAREVHDYVDKRYQGDDGKYKLTLTLVNKRGEDRTSQMVRYRYERDHLSKVLLTYVSPADVRGTTTMTIEQKDADDIQRIYIPSMKKNRRIASSDKGRSWAGTDFTYEDLQEHEVDDWNYGELKTDIVDGHECYFYVTTPVTPDKSCYTRIENWVRKDILEPVRAKYWDEKGKYLKELNFRDLRKIQGIWSAMYWEMENVQEGHKTVFKVEKVIYNTDLKEDMFTPRSMVDVPLDF